MYTTNNTWIQNRTTIHILNLKDIELDFEICIILQRS